MKMNHGDNLIKTTKQDTSRTFSKLLKEYTGYKGTWLEFKPQHIEKARTTFAYQMTDNETPLLFHDGSLLQNGKSGLLITDRAIYTSYSSTKRIPLNQIHSVMVEKNNVTVLYISSMPHLLVNGQYILYVCDAVDFIEQVLKTLSKNVQL
jgi:hypothetical protein